MGQILSTIKDQSKSSQKEDERELESTMDVLYKMLQNKLDIYEKNMLLNNKDDKMIPIETIVAINKIIKINVSDKPCKELENTIGEFFEGDYMEGLKGLAMTALNILLGSSDGSENEMTNYTIVCMYNTIIRIDYMMYNYTVQTSGFSDRLKNGFCCLLVISSVDITKISIGTLAYVIGKGSKDAQNSMKREQYYYQNFILKITKADDNIKKELLIEFYNNHLISGELSEEMITVKNYIEKFVQLKIKPKKILIQSLELKNEIEEDVEKIIKSNKLKDEVKEEVDKEIITKVTTFCNEIIKKLSLSLQNISDIQIRQINNMTEIFKELNKMKQTIKNE